MLVCSLAVGAILFAADKTSAQALSKLNVSGTFTYQLPDTISGNVTTSKTKTVKFNNKSIIAALNASDMFLAAAGISSIPAKSTLIMDDNNNIIVTNKSGFSVNLTDLGFATLSEADLTVSSGTYDDTTFAEKDKGIGTICTVFITDGATDETDIVISGLTQHTYSASKVNASGVHSVKSSGSVTGSGVGLFEGNDAVVQGKLTGSGSGKETVFD
jgi:hypothetical protein